MIIATAGHIDHGKTTLVRALTGMDTDRLPEEKSRGISIDLGFAHGNVAGRTVGFIDVPGHERFVRNMLSGVYAVGHVLLVIAADDGVMPQTREHLHIVGLLGVDQATVVITKRDRVGAERLAEVEREARELVRGTSLQEAPIVAVSTLDGTGMDVLRARLESVVAADSEAVAADPRLPRYVVDRAFTVAGSGTVVTGTVIAGSIAVGDSLVVHACGRQARVRKLQQYGRAIDRACAGQRCAINLAGVELAEVGRGGWLVAQEAHHLSDRLDVRMHLLAATPAPLKHWATLHVHIGAADVPARLAMRRGAPVAPGEQAFAQLRLARPVQAAHGDRFILRDESATRTLGGGVVLDARPGPHYRAGRADVLSALDNANARAGLAALLALGPGRVDLDWFAGIYGLPLARVIEMLPPETILIQAHRHVALTRSVVAALQDQVMRRLRRFHAEEPVDDGIELDRLRNDVAPSFDAEVFRAIVKGLPAQSVRLDSSRLRLAEHDSTDNPRDLLAWQRIVPLLMQAGAAIPSVRELAAQSRIPLLQLRDLVHRKAAGGHLVKLTLERFALPETMKKLRQSALETGARCAGGQFTAAQFRDQIGTGRGLAIEILECMDRTGVTTRRGDLREVRELHETS